MKRSLLIAAALLGLAAPALAQTRALPPGEIRANGDITFGNALKLGKREGNKTVITPDTLQILGTGSVGDIRGMSSLGAGSVVRTLLDRFGERPSVLDYGADPTGVADSTAAFTQALASGRPISAPCGVYRIVSTIAVAKRADFRGAGYCTLLKFDQPAGQPVLPVLDIQPGAAQSNFDSFRVDHQANVKGYQPNTVYGGNIIASSAVIVQADDVIFSRVYADNAYDNGISVVQFQGTTGTVVPSAPKRVSFQAIRTSYCGVGSTPKFGAGIDIGSGSQAVVNDFVDVGSYGAFILDVGAGAQGTFSNMTGIATKVDPAQGYSYSFYIGSTDSAFSNLTSIAPEYGGMWIDGFTEGTTVSNFYVKAPKFHGVKLKGGNSTLSNIIINSPGYTKPDGTVEAVEIDSTANTTNNITINNLSVRSEFNRASTTFKRLGSGAVTGAALNVNSSGSIAVTDNMPATFGVIDGATLGTVMSGAWINYTPTVTCATGGQSLASVTASAQYRRVGRTVSVNISTIGIVDRGTCTGAVNISLPLPVSIRTTFSGQETAVSGVALVGVVNEGSSNMQVKRTDGATPAVNGYVLTGRTEYQTP